MNCKLVSFCSSFGCFLPHWTDLLLAVQAYDEQEIVKMGENHPKEVKKHINNTWVEL